MPSPPLPPPPPVHTPCPPTPSYPPTPPIRAPPPSSEEHKAKEEAEKRKALYDIMSCMRDIRKRTDRTDNMFEPLKDTVTLLQSFQIPLPDSVIQQLDNAVDKWRVLKKKMLNRREQLASLQQYEAIEIRRKSDAFNERVEAFRKFFLQKAPFAVGGEGAELKLDQVGRRGGGARARGRGMAGGRGSKGGVWGRSGWTRGGCLWL